MARRSLPSRSSSLVPSSGPVPLSRRTAPAPKDFPRRFHHGTHAPFGVRWFGSSALFGHLRHLFASAIASESVDPRDWMRPQQPSKLLASVARVLAADPAAPNLVAALGRPLWIDFVADTGDDRDVSGAVARMVFREYRYEHDGEVVDLPRGDVLLFGGDTTYPVSTADEIFRRLTQPWNEVLREVDDGQPRVVLGIPGNHDWYDGLDGFARLFRRGAEPVRHDDLEAGHTRRPRHRSKAGYVARQLHLDEVGASLGILQRFWVGIGAFFKGEGVRRRKRLGFRGYEAVQECSYFALQLSEDLDLWAVDRQLRTVDFRQRSFFAKRRQYHPTRRVCFLAADPAFAFGEPNAPGMKALQACAVRLERDPTLFLTGDMHHYERRGFGPSTHVIAGGGGAFLHGTRIGTGPGGEPDCAYPSGAESRALVLHVPLRMMLGVAGFIPHMVFAAVALVELTAAPGSVPELLAVLGFMAAFIFGFYFSTAHHRQHPWSATAVAVPFGAFMGALPVMIRDGVPVLRERVPHLATHAGVTLLYAFLGAFVFGLFLMTCAIFGIEHQQAFAALGHPGYKHFVRICIQSDGTVHAYTIGKDDPLAPGTHAAVIDTFRW